MSRRLCVWDHPSFGAHDPGPGHPERGARHDAARRALSGLDVDWLIAPRGDGDLAATVHDRRFVDDVLASEGRSVAFDPDTHTSPDTVDAALRAIGAAAAAADLLDRGVPSFALARPPGHHATRDRAMGFCVFNHSAVAAERLARAGHRVVVFDPDAHHGNGTQDIFWERGDVLYASMHRFPFYPGTGAASERGAGPGLGATCNAPLRAGAGDAAYQAAFERIILPAVRAFAPDRVVISAGFDALDGDPLGGMALTAPALAAMVRAFAERWPTMAVLEGGYDLSRITEGVAATAAALIAAPRADPEA
jgi:acetoin utilization deacetylase AcuC-like enzyme